MVTTGRSIEEIREDLRHVHICTGGGSGCGFSHVYDAIDELAAARGELDRTIQRGVTIWREAQRQDWWAANALYWHEATK